MTTQQWMSNNCVSKPLDELQRDLFVASNLRHEFITNHVITHPGA
jgi:hypothetical protein